MEEHPGFSPEVQKEILEVHLDLGPRKAISYLPIKTVEKVLRLSLPEYVSMTESAGNKVIVLGMDNAVSIPGQCLPGVRTTCVGF